MTSTTEQGRHTDVRALAAAGVTTFLWASAFVVIRDAGEHFSPGALALGRLLAGAVVLVSLMVVYREGIPRRAAWPGIACAGVLWFGMYMVTLNWGERLVDAGTAALVVNVGPILIALLGGWLLKEGFPARLMIGVVVAFAGAAVIGLSGAGQGGSSVLGILLCLLAAVGYAAGVIGQKVALRHASGLQVTTLGCVIGAVACLPFTPGLLGDLSEAPLGATAGMVYLGVFPTALAFYSWTYALSRTTAGELGATTYIVPALVVVMSWLFLGEVPRSLALVGGALCMVGVGLSRGRRVSPPRVARSAAPREG